MPTLSHSAYPLHSLPQSKHSTQDTAYVPSSAAFPRQLPPQHIRLIIRDILDGHVRSNSPNWQALLAGLHATMRQLHITSRNGLTTHKIVPLCTRQGELCRPWVYTVHDIMTCSQCQNSCTLFIHYQCRCKQGLQQLMPVRHCNLQTLQLKALPQNMHKPHLHALYILTPADQDGCSPGRGSHLHIRAKPSQQCAITIVQQQVYDQQTPCT